MTRASSLADSRSLEQIRRDWDARARDNPRRYINWPDVPNEEGAFFESGRVDYGRFVAPFLQQINFEPKGKTALEIGCGTGRIARWMSQDFSQYVGVDVSPEMVRIASAYHFPNTTFHAVSGGGLEGVPDASVDFVFSFAVFQHVPDKRATLNYLSETARVLRPGGIFRLQMKGLSSCRIGQLALEAGLSRELGKRRVRLPFLRFRRLDTWQGVSIPPSEAVRECTSRGLRMEEIEGKWTVLMWVGGRKGAAAE